MAIDAMRIYRKRGCDNYVASSFFDTIYEGGVCIWISIEYLSLKMM